MTRCVDIDECVDGSATCSPIVACGNLPGGYQCSPCPAGYQGDGHTCTDQDECSLGLDQCSDLVSCQNTVGGYTCGACPAGYTGQGLACDDIDECASHPCDPRADCTNSPGSFVCGACPSGFVGDGHTGCIDIDECNAGSDNCSDLVTCGNTLGGYTCSACPEGYAGDGHTCTDVDECAQGSAQCASHLGCTNTEGGYTCGACPPGFLGDGLHCTDIDECDGNPCDNLTSCQNVIGSYTCGACPSGYTGNGHSGCLDIDECAVADGGCTEAERCENAAGGHQCVGCLAAQVGVFTHCGVGACAAIGTTVCQRGVVLDTCLAGPASADDVSCDGRDDDCDGAIDEDVITERSSCGVGSCRAQGISVCSHGARVDSCRPDLPAQSDATCDGRDDDCDGSSDEDATTFAVHCGSGACTTAGQTSCLNGAWKESCVPPEPASATDESCNAVDDDCDGLVDEDYATTIVSCGLGVCANTGARLCSTGNVITACALLPPTASSDALCNGVDDDCDGLVDEDFVPESITCGLGRCTAGGWRSCSQGQLVDSCEPGTALGDTDSSCDGIDDDCDGLVDEDFSGACTWSRRVELGPGMRRDGGAVLSASRRADGGRRQPLHDGPM